MLKRLKKRTLAPAPRPKKTLLQDLKSLHPGMNLKFSKQNQEENPTNDVPKEQVRLMINILNANVKVMKNSHHSNNTFKNVGYI